LRILFVSSEAHPLIKTGGLADVVGALPAALHRLKTDARILIPGYPRVLEKAVNLTPVATLDYLPQIGSATLLQGEMPDTRTPVYVIQHPVLYERDGTPYQDTNAQDWMDNPLRFGILSHVAAVLGSGFSPLAWKPDILQCNDWQSGLAPVILHFFKTSHAKTVLGIHNLAYQGNFEDAWVGRLGLPPQSYQPAGLEFYGHLSFLKAGISYSDAIITVSPNYAKEIQTAEYGYGMEGLLTAHRAKLHGILNGIDTKEWNPAIDPFLSRNYDHTELNKKNANKKALQDRLGLDIDPNVPLLAVVSRMAYQKGLDILLNCASNLIRDGAQLAVLGSGDPTLEHGFNQLATAHPGRVSVTIGYNEPLSHQIMAGSDIFLMPSRYEPCGLNQLYGLAYGTPPVVRRTGGLADSVHNIDPHAPNLGKASGFTFEKANEADFLVATRRAIAAFHDKRTWNRIQQNGMKQDLGWIPGARKYLAIYRNLLKS
jgi:starch synthase